MKNASASSAHRLNPGPAQPDTGKQGVWQTRAAGVAQSATSRPERSQQRRIPVSGAAGRPAFMEYPG